MMENVSWAILEALRVAYLDGTKEGNELIEHCCDYLSTTTTDWIMEEECKEMLEELCNQEGDN